MLDPYARCFEGQAVGHKEFVICADEKTSIQAHPPGAGPTPGPHESCRCRLPRHALAPRAGSGCHHLLDLSRRRGQLPVVFSQRPKYLRPLHVVRGHVGDGPPAVVLMLDVHKPGFTRRQRRVATAPWWHNLRLVHLPKYASWLDQAQRSTSP